MCSHHNFVFIFFCSLSLLVECCWFKFLNIYFSGHFGFTSLIFFVSSFDLLFFQKFFSFILLLPVVPTSLFSSFISLLFCLQLNIYIFFLFFLFSITLLCHSCFSCVCFQVLIPMLRRLLLRKICLSSFSFHFFVLMLCRAFFKEKCETFVKNQAFNKKT